jgi:hypothetical protein
MSNHPALPALLTYSPLHARAAGDGRGAVGRSKDHARPVSGAEGGGGGGGLLLLPRSLRCAAYCISIHIHLEMYKAVANHWLWMHPGGGGGAIDSRSLSSGGALEKEL